MRFLSIISFAFLPTLAVAAPLDKQRLDRIDTAVEASLKRGDCPGAIVLVVHRDEVVYRKAFGHVSLQPEKKPLSVEAIYDLASLTKPIATATSVWILVEQGKLSLSDKVARHWPAFAANKKDAVTIEQLLLHTSGLTADNPVGDYKDGKSKALERIAELSLDAEPGRRFRYSDVGYIVLGQIVERISGESIDVFARKRIFEPLKMTSTGYKPSETLKDRCAPTAQRSGAWLIGEVHDPRAALLDGVAGHAGLFGSADNLARFSRMLLRGGELDGQRILAASTVRRFTEPHAVPGGQRSLGWDVDTAYSAERGDLFPRGKGFGHTGFTGTSIWIDTPSQTAIIILTNRVHIGEKAQVTKLRREIATIVAMAVMDP
jgi:CubicO group peptidase (beta-lactamase class C family)